MPGKYKNINELKDDLHMLSDIEFGYKDKKYFICPVNDNFSAGEIYKEPINFDSVDELIDNFKIQKQYLKDIVTEINIYAR
ncbi:MAG: hypothetical protein N4A48_04100 [Tepidibacter sp.]|uniref:hypothetical protein n=1 Tax=Tepidibacter sp. TaxID=2529387 RepID=UPI0025E3F838|nr:hypothetical protein [Tepidibacter sp.]MCT4507932.1 hypothetical protein [Tepidibacter sp.]